MANPDQLTSGAPAVLGDLYRWIREFRVDKNRQYGNLVTVSLWVLLGV